MLDFNDLLDGGFDNDFDDDLDNDVEIHQETEQDSYDNDLNDEDDFETELSFNDELNDEDNFETDQSFYNHESNDELDNNDDIEMQQASSYDDTDFDNFEEDEWNEILNSDFAGIQEEVDAEFEAYEEDMFNMHPGALGDAPNYMNFDLAQMDLNDVIGDVAEDMSNWHEQEGNTCAVVAQEFILEALTGEEYDMDELRELAEENGWYDDGTPLWDVGNLLEYHGLEVDKFMNGTIEDIQQCLEQGGKVIVGVDSDEVWEGCNDEFFLPGTDADHAVQVSGIDYSNPDNPMIILNDSGVANGCGAMIPMKNFMDAWSDSGYFMVTAYEGE